MKYIFTTYLLLFLLNIGLASSRPVIYLIPGQGADYRIFNNLQINEAFTIRYIEFELPARGMKLKDYATQLSKQIDTTKAFVIVGVSLGGMIATEMADFLEPEQVIIISSAKSRFELPKKYTFQKYIPLYKLFPGILYKIGAQVLQPIFEHDRQLEKETFKAMLKAKDPKFLKRTANMIVNWERTAYNKDLIIHIHGDRDNTLPLKRILSEPQILIADGSHLLTLTRGKEVSFQINKIIEGLVIRLVPK